MAEAHVLAQHGGGEKDIEHDGRGPKGRDEDLWGEAQGDEVDARCDGSQHHGQDPQRLAYWSLARAHKRHLLRVVRQGAQEGGEAAKADAKGPEAHGGSWHSTRGIETTPRRPVAADRASRQRARASASLDPRRCFTADCHCIMHILESLRFRPMEELVYDRKRKGDESWSRHVVVEWGKRSKKVKVTGDLLASILSACGSVSRAEVGEAGRCGFASFGCEDEAARAVAELNGVSCERLRWRKLRIAFADLIDVAEREARYLPIECTSATAGVEVPGLELQEQWVSAAEEEELLSAIAAAPWDCHLRRRVQHYGFPFDYVTRSARTSEPLGPLPPWLARLRDRVASLFPSGEPPDQFTVNEYAPGEGISQHVDTPEAFGPVLATLSLGSDTVMGLWCLGAVSLHKNLALPRRALLVFCGEARHWWTHGIARRRVDVVDGRTQRRGRRVSITMRRVRHPHRVGADVPSLPVAGGAGAGHVPASAGSTPPHHPRSQLTRLEKEHVHKVRGEAAGVCTAVGGRGPAAHRPARPARCTRPLRRTSAAPATRRGRGSAPFCSARALGR